MSEFLRAQDVAVALGVTAGRIYQMAQNGEIPAVRVGSKKRGLRFPRAEWERWLAEKNAEAREAVTR